MEQRLDIYKRKDIYAKEQARMAKSAISEANKALIAKYCRDLFSNGISELRAAKLSAQLRKLAALFGKDFDNVTIFRENGNLAVEELDREYLFKVSQATKSFGN